MYNFQTSTVATIALTLVLIISTVSAAKLELSEVEQVALQILREYIEDLPLENYQLKDSYLIGWIRANEGNAFFAAQQLDETLQWRKDNNIDNILNETIPSFPGYIVSKIGMDIEGRPVLTKSIKNLNLKKIIENGKKDAFFRYNFQILEQMVARTRFISNMTGEHVYQIYSIVDFKGFNKKQHDCKDCLETIVQLYKDTLQYYHGLRFREVWINTPKIATPLVKVIRALYANSNEELKIFGTDRTEWSKFLHKDIPSDQLTFQFGGTRPVSSFLQAI